MWERYGLAGLCQFAACGCTTCGLNSKPAYLISNSPSPPPPESFFKVRSRPLKHLQTLSECLTWCHVSLTQKAAEDVCSGLFFLPSAFNTRSVGQITSAEQRPKANIPVNFFHSRFICHLPHSFPTWERPALAPWHAEDRSVRRIMRHKSGHIWCPSLTGGRGRGSWSWGSSSCLACPFVFLMTWLRKVSRSIQKALRVILPDDRHFPHFLPWGKGDVSKVLPHWKSHSESNYLFN